MRWRMSSAEKEVGVVGQPLVQKRDADAVAGRDVDDLVRGDPSAVTASFTVAFSMLTMSICAQRSGRWRTGDVEKRYFTRRVVTSVVGSLMVWPPVGVLRAIHPAPPSRPHCAVMIPRALAACHPFPAASSRLPELRPAGSSLFALHIVPEIVQRDVRWNGCGQSWG